MKTTVQKWFGGEFGRLESFSFCGGELAHFAMKCPTRVASPGEDSSCCIELDSGLGVLAVADGVGGAVSGDRASQTAVEVLVAACEQSGLQSTGHFPPTRGLRGEILDSFEEANRKILSWSSGAATTMSVVEYCHGAVRAFHVGDSNVMLMSNRGNVKFATVGHGPVAQAVDLGLLEEGEAMLHEDRNLITNCIGSKAMKIEVGPTISMAARDTLLIASDGLFDNLITGEIIELMRRGQLIDQTQKLVTLARERMTTDGTDDLPSKPDDLTILVFRQISRR
jgi:serine/threonine protein phosphatase PrpC